MQLVNSCSSWLKRYTILKNMTSEDWIFVTALNSIHTNHTHMLNQHTVQLLSAYNKIFWITYSSHSHAFWFRISRKTRIRLCYSVNADRWKENYPQWWKAWFSGGQMGKDWGTRGKAAIKFKALQIIKNHFSHARKEGTGKGPIIR